tara:strand:+ start:9478 stop:10200 length:723 start_codon:yes stop_codon:yes gene_type:complete
MNELKTYKNFFGLIVDDNKGTKIFGWENLSKNRNTKKVEIPLGGGVYGYVDTGIVEIIDDNVVNLVKAGSWFSTRSGCKINFLSEKYRVAAWQKSKYLGSSNVGYVEDYGRLNYIDGCKDTILAFPIKKGLPCLNALYMPTGVNQTMHTHPSTRSGFIIVGGAKAVTPDMNVVLETGMIFYLPTDTEHKFVTDHENNTIMKLIAYHPDSDFGATDETHPMINRTIVEGISASKLDDIRTK